MSEAPKFTLSNESVMVYHDGKMHTVQKGSPNYQGIRKAILEERWDDIPKHLTVTKSLSEYVKGKFTLLGDSFSFDGKPLPSGLNQKIVNMATRGDDPTPLLKFWERLQANPSFRSVEQLWSFLNHLHIPFTKDGCFLAYKSVRAGSFLDHHTGKLENKPGMVLEMPRNKISDDPRTPCHEGLHVGALGYAQTFGGDREIVICKVDPADVVCVPYDSSAMKMRVCKYKVIGIWNGDPMPDELLDDELAEEHTVQDEGTVEESEAAGDENIVAPLDDEGYEVEADDGSGEEVPDDEDDTETTEETPAPVEPKIYVLGDAQTEHVTKSQVRAEKSKLKTSKDFKAFDEMDGADLSNQSIDDLRKYATHHLKLVGASKIPGGKTGLIKKISQFRKKLK